MNFRLKICFGILSLFFTAHSFAGPGASGGGRGVVCRNPQNGQIESVELLDLWEARVLYKRNIAESNESVKLQVDAAMDRLKFSLDLGSAIYDDIKYSPSEHFLKLAHEKSDLFLNDSPNVRRLRGVKLEPTPDSNEPASPGNGNCRVEQIVNYIDSKHDPLILVDQDLMDNMSATNQAALIVHEAFYALLRDAFPPEKDSVRVRRSVGYVFSGKSFPSKGSLLKSKYVECTTPIREGAIPGNFASVYFYLGSNQQMKAVSGYAFGEPTIGYFESSDKYGFGNDFDYVLTDKICQRGGTVPQPTMYSLLPGWGPADFTKQNMLIFVCDNFKLSLHFSKKTEYSPENKLSCQLIEK